MKLLPHAVNSRGNSQITATGGAIYHCAFTLHLSAYAAYGSSNTNGFII